VALEVPSPVEVAEGVGFGVGFGVGEDVGVEEPVGFALAECVGSGEDDETLGEAGSGVVCAAVLSPLDEPPNPRTAANTATATTIAV
jgi:hypothetical protein